MNFAGNFVHIGNVDIQELRDLVVPLSDEQWNEFSIRHQRYEVHRDTRMIGLVYDPDFRHSHPTRLPPLERFAPAIQETLATAAEHYESSPEGTELVRRFGLGYFVRATLVRLMAGCGINAHQDLNFSLTHSHRVHLPIVSNDRVRFSVGSETINMREGEIYEINNRRVHSVQNDGSADRIHLILDFVLPGQMCCCGKKHHPQTLCSPQACLDTVRLKVPCTCFPEA
jgi:hypothetical protein